MKSLVTGPHLFPITTHKASPWGTAFMLGEPVLGRGGVGSADHRSSCRQDGVGTQWLCSAVGTRWPGSIAEPRGSAGLPETCEGGTVPRGARGNLISSTSAPQTRGQGDNEVSASRSSRLSRRGRHDPEGQTRPGAGGSSGLCYQVLRPLEASGTAPLHMCQKCPWTLPHVPWEKNCPVENLCPRSTGKPSCE